MLKTADQQRVAVLVADIREVLAGRTDARDPSELLKFGNTDNPGQCGYGHKKLQFCVDANSRRGFR